MNFKTYGEQQKHLRCKMCDKDCKDYPDECDKYRIEEVQMSNYRVIQTMTIRELSNLLNDITRFSFYDERDWEEWLRTDSQADGGLLTDEIKKYWKVH